MCAVLSHNKTFFTGWIRSWTDCTPCSRSYPSQKKKRLRAKRRWDPSLQLIMVTSTRSSSLKHRYLLGYRYGGERTPKSSRRRSSAKSYSWRNGGGMQAITPRRWLLRGLQKSNLISHAGSSPTPAKDGKVPSERERPSCRIAIGTRCCPIVIVHFSALLHVACSNQRSKPEILSIL